MMIRIVHYLTALVALSGMSVVYQNLVTPWMKPPEVQRIPLAEVSGPRTDESLHALFAPGAWQRGQCRQLQTKDMTLLYQEFKREADDRISLSPITIVVGHGMSPMKDPNPVIIEATEGAEITFAHALDLLGGNRGAPPIEHGRIQGEVRIHRGGSDDDQPFEIKTSKVGIRNRKVWTPAAIEMRVGDAHCLGRDLTIHLAAPAAAGTRAAENLLDRIELIYLDQVSIPLPPSAPTLEDPHPKRSHVSVNCQGRLEYDFAIDQLQLHDQVALTHQMPGSNPDQILCDLLSIRLHDPTNRNINRNGPLDWLVGISATGSPASVKAPSYGMELLADKIQFEARKGLLQARGKAGIQVRYNGITARLANLVYQFDANQVEALGAIDVQGPGIVRIDDASVPLRELKWRDRFKLFPIGQLASNQPNREVEFQIDGDFYAQLSDGGEFHADAVAGVLKSDSDNNLTADQQNSMRRLVPDRVVASGNVRIDTTAVSAETQRMFVQFVALPNPQPSAGKKVDSSSADVDRTGNSIRQWVSQPGGVSELTAPIARARPVIRGDAINVQLRRNEAGLSVRKLSIAGSVHAEHELTTGGQSLPAKFTGELLQLIDGGGEDVLEIVGGTDQPARFDFGDGFFIGPKIQIHPSANLVSINQAGEFRIPTAALPMGASGDTGQPIKWTKPPHCRWNGEMRFDGRMALLTGGVQIQAAMENDGQPWDVEMLGDQLQVDLVEGVEIRNLKTMRTATVRAVSLVQTSNRPVLLTATGRAADGVRESKHMLQTQRLTFTPTGGGSFVGQGPGWYRGWFAPDAVNGRGFALPATNRQQSSRQASTLGSESNLNAVHLVFGDSMRGDLAMRKIDFLKGVRVGIRPVTGWDQTFDATQMDSISTGESTLDCDQLRFAIDPSFQSAGSIAGLATPWEVEATRGVVFRTRNEQGLIEGTASRAAYTSGKQLFTAEGAPNRPAIVQQMKPDGSPGVNLRVRTTSIHLGTMTIVNQVLEGFSIPAPQ